MKNRISSLLIACLTTICISCSNSSNGGEAKNSTNSKQFQNSSGEAASSGFKNISGLDARLYVSDYATGQIRAYNINVNSTETKITHENIPGLSKLKGPVDIKLDKFDKSAQYLYVTYLKTPDNDNLQRLEKFKINSDGSLTGMDYWRNLSPSPFKLVTSNNTMVMSSYNSNQLLTLNDNGTTFVDPTNTTLSHQEHYQSSDLVETPNKNAFFEGNKATNSIDNNIVSLSDKSSTLQGDSVNALAATNHSLYAVTNTKLYNYTLKPDKIYNLTGIEPQILILDKPGNHVVASADEKYVFVSDATSAKVHIYHNQDNKLTYMFDYDTKEVNLLHPDIMTMDDTGTLLFISDAYDGSTAILSFDNTPKDKGHYFRVGVFEVGNDGNLKHLDTIEEEGDYPSRSSISSMVAVTTASPLQNKEFVYLPDYSQNLIHQFRPNEWGGLDYFGSVSSSCKGPWKMTVADNNKFVDVSCKDDKSIHSYTIDPDSGGWLNHSAAIKAYGTPVVTALTHFEDSYNSNNDYFYDAYVGYEENNYFASIYQLLTGNGALYHEWSCNKDEVNGYSDCDDYVKNILDYARTSPVSDMIVIGHELFEGFKVASGDNMSLKEYTIKSGGGQYDYLYGNPTTIYGIGSVNSLYSYDKSLYAVTSKDGSRYLYHYPLESADNNDHYNIVQEKVHYDSMGPDSSDMINGGRLVVVTRDGRFAYTANPYENKIRIYSLDPSGTPALINEHITNNSFENLKTPGLLATSIDGNLLYVSTNNKASNIPVVNTYKIGPDGNLSFLFQSSLTSSVNSVIADMVVADVILDPIIFSPTKNSTNVVANTKIKIKVPLNINWDSVNNQSIKLYVNNSDGNQTIIDTSVESDKSSQTVIVSPNNSLDSAKTYTVVLSGLYDQVGGIYPDIKQSFTTETNGTAPVAILTQPTSDQLGNLPVDSSFTVYYGPNVNRETVSVNYSVFIEEFPTKGSPKIFMCNYRWDGGSLVLTPQKALNKDSSYVLYSNSVYTIYGDGYNDLSIGFRAQK